jgi:hypothetical protein
MRSLSLGVAWAFAAATLVAGCELITGLNSLEANGGKTATGSGGQSTTASTASSASSSSDASSSSSAASSGSGGMKPMCSDPVADCPKSTTLCKTPICKMDKCDVMLAMKGATCSDSGGTVCDDAGNCVSVGCTNNAQDGTETDVDCGGSCTKACANGKGCNAAKDCQSGVCDISKPKVDPNKMSAGACAPCTADNQCPGGYCDDTTKFCTVPKMNGAVCTKNSGCASKFCADGFCCDTACDKPCEACSMALNAVQDGKCILLSGVGDKKNMCAPYFCDGKSANCATSCSTNNDCYSMHYCEVNMMPQTCQMTKAKGTMCTGDYQCLTGYCTDSTCCDTAPNNCAAQGKKCNNAMGMCM